MVILFEQYCCEPLGHNYELLDMDSLKYSWSKNKRVHAINI